MNGRTEVWSEFPPSPSQAGSGHDPAARSPIARFLLMWAIIAPVPAAALSGEGAAGSPWAIVGLSGLAAAAATLGAARSPHWWVPYVITAAVSLGAIASGGWSEAVAMALSGSVACWAILGRHPSKLPVIAADAAPRILGLTLLAAVVTAAFDGVGAVPATLVVTAVVTLMAFRPAPFRSFGDAVGSAAARLGSLVVAITVAVVGVFLVLVPWLFQRLLRWDPLWVPRPARSRWVAVGAGLDDPADLWDRDARLVRTTPGRRAHRAALFVLGALALVGIIGTALWIPQVRSERERYSTAALADSPWWPAMSDAIDIAYGRSPISSYVGVMMADASYPGFNVAGGRRATWRPPAADCEPLTVWMFGGSTMFGLGQRDGHTIASELARRAWEDGVALEVDNWGVPADTFWMETRRLQLALQDADGPPDLVIFYDGANDFRVQSRLNAEGRGGERLFANDLDAEALPGIEARNRRLADLMDVTRDGPQMSTEPSQTLSPGGVGRFAADGYSATAELIGPFLEERGIAQAHFYQPSRVTRRPNHPDEVPSDQANEDYQGEIEAAFRENLPEGIIDLSAAMDRSDEAVYFDELHTNEAGARLVADAMWVALQGDPGSAYPGGGGSCR